MRGLRPHSALAVACLTATLACAACSGAGGGSSSATTDATPPSSSGTHAPTTPGSTPSAAGPIVPSAARAHTPEGAVAFARFYIAEVNTAWTTPRTGLIPALSLPSCKACSVLEASTQQLQAGGYKYQGATLSLEDAKYGVVKPTGREAVTANVRETPQPVVSSTRTQAPTGRVTLSPTSIELSWGPGGWKMLEIKDLK